MRWIFAVSTVALAACSASPPDPALAGRDVGCLDHQVRELGRAMPRSVAACGAARPDLTGNDVLQRLALASHIPFTIRPIADARIKQEAVLVPTGSLIPQSRTEIVETGPVYAGTAVIGSN